MASKTSSTRRRAGSRQANRSTVSRSGRAQDAVKLLKEDHARVRQLFERFQKARGDEQKSKLAETICTELKVHTQLEEELFYPAARRALEDGEILDEAQVEHESAKQLISQIESSDPSDPLFEAKVKVLCEYVNHHVKEEEGEMFPQVRRTDLDLADLGMTMKQRKQQLQARRPSGIGARLTRDSARPTA